MSRPSDEARILICATFHSYNEIMLYRTAVQRTANCGHLDFPPDTKSEPAPGATEELEAWFGPEARREAEAWFRRTFPQGDA